MQQPDRQRIEHILDYCADVEKTTASLGNSYDRFTENRAYQYSVAFCILQIGELAGRLSPELRAKTGPAINWTAIRGMRNIVVHDYGNVDIEVLWDAAIHDIPALRSFCEQMLHA